MVQSWDMLSKWSSLSKMELCHRNVSAAAFETNMECALKAEHVGVMQHAML